MQIASDLTDDAVLAELGVRLRRARLDRGQLTQEQLAAEAGVSTATVARIEAGQSTQTTSLVRVLRQLGLLEGMDRLIPDSYPSPIELLQRGKRSRQRGRARRSAPTAKPWRWGDEEAPDS